MIHRPVITVLGILCAAQLAFGPARADIVVTGQQATIRANGVAASPPPATPGFFSHTNGSAMGSLTTGWSSTSIEAGGYAAVSSGQDGDAYVQDVTIEFRVDETTGFALASSSWSYAPLCALSGTTFVPAVRIVDNDGVIFYSVIGNSLCYSHPLRAHCLAGQLPAGEYRVEVSNVRANWWASQQEPCSPFPYNYLSRAQASFAFPACDDGDADGWCAAADNCPR